MRPLFVVLDLPGPDFATSIEQILKPAHRQRLFPQPSVKAFDIRRSALAFPAGCAPTRSAAPRTKPENADSLVPIHCRSESPAVVPAQPRSHPALASLFGWRNSCPLPKPRSCERIKSSIEVSDSSVTLIACTKPVRASHLASTPIGRRYSYEQLTWRVSCPSTARWSTENRLRSSRLKNNQIARAG